jgi:ElaB/YqjD/DUF883 family membrane-anchored ribosome-binding protein
MAGMDDIGTEVGQLRRDIAGIKNDLGSLMAALKDMGMEQGREMYGRAREAGQVIHGQAVQATEQAGHFIEARPVTSVTVAFGAGFALGAMMCASARSHH